MEFPALGGVSVRLGLCGSIGVEEVALVTLHGLNNSCRRRRGVGKRCSGKRLVEVIDVVESSR